jgi:hypothetical protein
LSPVRTDSQDRGYQNSSKLTATAPGLPSGHGSKVGEAANSLTLQTPPDVHMIITQLKESETPEKLRFHAVVIAACVDEREISGPLVA